MPLILLGDSDELHRQGARRFAYALLHALPQDEGCQELRQALSYACAALERGFDLEQAAGRFAAVIQDAAHLTARQAEDAIAALRYDLRSATQHADWYRRAYEELQQSLEAQRLDELKKQVEARERQAAQAQERIHTLEQALVAEQQAHRQDVSRLQQTIADLNRIVARQQLQLNAFLEKH